MSAPALLRPPIWLLLLQLAAASSALPSPAGALCGVAGGCQLTSLAASSSISRPATHQLASWAQVAPVARVATAELGGSVSTPSRHLSVANAAPSQQLAALFGGSGSGGQLPLTSYFNDDDDDDDDDDNDRRDRRQDTELDRWTENLFKRLLKFMKQLNSDWPKLRKRLEMWRKRYQILMDIWRELQQGDLSDPNHWLEIISSHHHEALSTMMMQSDDHDHQKGSQPIVGRIFKALGKTASSIEDTIRETVIEASSAGEMDDAHEHELRARVTETARQTIRHQLAALLKSTVLDAIQFGAQAYLDSKGLSLLDADKTQQVISALNSPQLSAELGSFVAALIELPASAGKHLHGASILAAQTNGTYDNKLDRAPLGWVLGQFVEKKADDFSSNPGWLTTPPQSHSTSAPAS